MIDSKNFFFNKNRIFFRLIICKCSCRDSDSTWGGLKLFPIYGFELRFCSLNLVYWLPFTVKLKLKNLLLISIWYFLVFYVLIMINWTGKCCCLQLCYFKSLQIYINRFENVLWLKRRKSICWKFRKWVLLRKFSERRLIID